MEGGRAEGASMTQTQQPSPLASPPSFCLPVREMAIKPPSQWIPLNGWSALSNLVHVRCYHEAATHQMTLMMVQQVKGQSSP